MTSRYVAALLRAADDLDAAWDTSAAHGMRDPRPSPEYVDKSPAPVLRELAERLQNEDRPT